MNSPSSVTTLRRGGTLPNSERWVSAQTRNWPLQTDWSRLLRDLTHCGVVRLRIGNPALRLQSVVELRTANSNDGLAWVNGPGLILVGIADRWAHASICRHCPSRPFEHVDISDHRGNRLLTIESDRIAYADLVRGTSNEAMPGVRLYDETGNCVSTFYLPEHAANSDRVSWQTLLRALSS